MIDFLKVFFFFVAHAFLTILCGYFAQAFIMQNLARPTSMAGGIANHIISTYIGFFIFSVLFGVIMYYLFLG